MRTRKRHTARIVASAALAVTATVGLSGAAGTAGASGVGQGVPDEASVGTVTATALSDELAGARAAAMTAGRAVGDVSHRAATHGTTTVPASAQDRREIRAAVKRSPLTSAVDPSDYRVGEIRLSRTNPAWAAAMIRPTIPLDDAAVLAHHVNGRWKVVTLGTAQIGCGLAPDSVLQDFSSYDSIGSCR